MEGPVTDILLKLLRYFHNPELVGSLLLLYVVVSGKSSLFRCWVHDHMHTRLCNVLI